MANDFLKLNIVENLKQNNLHNIICNDENFHLLNHNIENLKDVLEFLNSEKEQLIIINGFMNSGKTCLVDFVVENLLNDYIIPFNINFNGLNHIDDIYVQIYNSLVQFHHQHKIQMEKLHIKEFSQKILSHLLAIKQPVVFVFDFDENNNDAIIKELILFINELIAKRENPNSLKVIINSLSFNFDLLNIQDYQNSIIRPYNLEDIKYELFDVNNSNQNTAFFNSKCNLSDCEYFYKITRGHYLYIELIKILEQNYNISVNEFLNQYKNQKLYILDFIISRLMNNYYNKFKNFFLFLTVNRFQTPIEFLFDNNFITRENLNLLIANKIVKKYKNIVYIKSYIKKYVLNNVNDELKVNPTKLLVSIYKNQLELSPLKRKFKVSRASLHHEIEYHNNFLNKFEEQLKSRDKHLDITTISYTKSQGIITGNIKKNEKNLNLEKDKKKTEEKIISPFALTREEQLLLTSSFDNSITNIKNNFIQEEKDSEKNKEILNNDENENSNQIENLFKMALEFEKKLEYFKAIDIYHSILDKDIKESDKKLIYTFTKLGMLYQKLSNYKKALNFYKKALEICINNNETIKAYYIYYQIAKIYKATFKNDLANEIYKKILNDKKVTLPIDLKIQITNDYVEILNDPKNVIETLLNIKDIVNNSDDIGLKIDYYYKLAGGFDDLDDINKAKESYYKCLSFIDSDKSSCGQKLVGTIYFNLASICLDENNNDEAYEYFKLSLKYEIENQNYEEAYFAAINLGKMLLYKRTEEAFQYFKDALLYANKLNDKFYLAESQLNLGDYYYFIKNDEEALKYFLFVLSIAIKNNFSNENIENVKSRLKDLKIRLGEEKYNIIVNNIKRGITQNG